MYSPKTLVLLVFALFVGAQLVAAGPGGHVSLINATPYEWKLSYSHNYQMDWNPSKVVAPGTSVLDYFEFLRNHKDEAAEAVYTLVGHPRNALFTLQARSSQRKQLQIQYNDDLHSLNNPQKSLINLYWQHDGAVCFILSGDGIDVPFISTNPPIAWMQATLPTIGSKSMREIAMPASHDAGASELTRTYLGNAHNTITQSGHVYQQLINGARYFDLRPIVRRKKWYTSHLTFSPVLSSGVGGFGRTIENIVWDINQFTFEYPGEFIILELSHDMDKDNFWKPITPQQWQELYSKLLGIKDIWLAPSDLPEDISTVPISTFIQPGSKTAVIIRIPNGAPLPETRNKSRDLEEAKWTMEVNSSAGEYDLHIPEGELAKEVNNSTGKYDLGISEDVNGDQRDTGANPAIATITALSDVPHILTTDLPTLRAVPKPTPVSKLVFPVVATLGFFHEHRLPQTGSYSNAQNEGPLSKDQIAKLKDFRKSRQSEPLRSTWTITPRMWHLLDVATKGHSILGETAWAHRVLFGDLWRNLTPDRYPNLVEVDDFWNSQVTALCMAINDYFAGRDEAKEGERGRVGRLQGREMRI